MKSLSLKRSLGVTNATLYIILTVLMIGILLTLVNVWELRKLQTDHYVSVHGQMPEAGAGLTNPRLVWIPGKPVLVTDHLKHVRAVLRRLGFTEATQFDDWELLWSWDYPFAKYHDAISKLKPYQKVNHFPGSGFFTNKNSLAISPIRNIPRAFKIPDQKKEFLKEAKANPNSLWVQKSNTHRGIRITRVEDLDLGKEGSFVQTFVQNPLLIDKRKFDIGIYTVVTSIDPLRVYVMDTEALFRYCARDYHPFKADDPEKYVVGDNYTPTWQMPSLKKFYQTLSYNHKDSFNAYMTKMGYKTDRVWQEMYTTIREVFENKEHHLISVGRQYNTRNFFEMVRFDFLLDADLNVYLMEVNMSPNLSTGHFTQNRILYEQVLMSMFSLVGLSRGTPKPFVKADSVEKEMIVADHDLVTSLELTIKDDCRQNCDELECRLCLACLNEEEKDSLKSAFREHVNRMNMRRVVPPPLNQTEARSVTDRRKTGSRKGEMSRTNFLMHEWFRAKCLRDVTWCQ